MDAVLVWTSCRQGTCKLETAVSCQELVGSSRTCTLYTGVFVCVRESERECEGAVYSCAR